MAYGEAFYDAKWRFEDVDRGSWWFKSQFGGKFMGGWYDEGTDGINKKGGEGEGKERGKERLFLLREKDGLVFAPNIGLHPVKTNPL